MEIGVVIFPGSNCDSETLEFLSHYVGIKVNKIWHKETNIKKHFMYIFPGGFSYGDYMRAGKLATFSPALKEIYNHITNENSKALGICNGFQILCEMKILPGTLLKNENCQFICKTVEISNSTGKYMIPIAHGQGNYYHPNPETINVAYTYTDNPNGSVSNIAGIYNEKENVLGMMPHPERAFKLFHASQDGFKILDQFLQKNI